MEYIQRIFYEAISNKKRLLAAIKHLKKGKTDHISIMPGIFTHNRFLLLEELKQRAEWLKYVSNLCRKNGFKVDINILYTIGHFDVEGEIPKGERYQGFVGHNGVKGKSQFCFLDPDYRKYIKEKYRLFAECKPDILWIDDDFRLVDHRPVFYGCFCPFHMAQFNKDYDYSYLRTKLVSEILRDTFPESNSLRKRWVEWNGRLIENFLKELSDLVHKASAKTRMGFMNCNIIESSFAGMRFSRVMKILSSPKALAVFRPGAGYHTDRSPHELAYKAEFIATSVSFFPREFKSFSEIELSPYSSFEKSNAVLLREASMYILIGGVTGHTFNIFDDFGNPWDDRLTRLTALSKTKPYLTTLVSLIRGKEQQGVKEIVDETFFQNTRIREEEKIEERFSTSESDLADNEEPWSSMFALNGISRGFENKPPYVAAADSILSLNKKEIEEVMSGGIFLDWTAAYNLQESGYSKMLGVRLIDKNGWGNEYFTDHVLNSNYKDTWYRIGQTKKIEILDSSVRQLSILVDVNHQEVGPGICIYENRLGGRIAILPCPLNRKNFNFLGRRAQLRNILEWLDRRSLPCSVESKGFVTVAHWEDKAGCEAIIGLYSFSFDTQNHCIVHVGRRLGNKVEVKEVLKSGKVINRNFRIIIDPRKGSYSFDIGRLDPMDERVVVLQQIIA